MQSLREHNLLKIAAFYLFHFWKYCKSSNFVCSGLFKETKAEYYKHQCVFECHPGKSSYPAFHSKQWNKKESKLSAVSVPVTVFCILFIRFEKTKNNIKLNIYVGESEQRQNIFIFIFRIKTLQKAMRQACYCQIMSLCACVLYSLHYMTLMLCSVCRTVEIKGLYADWV